MNSLRKAGIFQKSDERILGNGDFVDKVLSDAQEEMDNRYLLAAKGIGMQNILSVVSDLLSIEPEALIGPSKERKIVRARVLVCYWSVRELGMPVTKVARHLGLGASTVSMAVKKGEKVIDEDGLKLHDMLNVKI